VSRVVRVVVLAALAWVSTAQAGEAYRNPTRGSVVALQIPNMHLAKVRRDLVYRRVGGRRLRMDVYRPRRAPLSRRLPIVIIGGPPAVRAGKESGQKIGWGQLMAASGLAAAVFDTRSDDYVHTPAFPSTDVATAISYVRAHGRKLGIDPNRVCTLGFSLGTAPWHLWATMHAPAPFVRCNVSYYGPLDLGELHELNPPPSFVEEYSAITYLRRYGAAIPPMLIAKAGAETNEGFNASIDKFVAEAQQRGADVRLVTHETGVHGFDLSYRDARARAIIRETLAFFRSRLLAPPRTLSALAPRALKPLRLRETCVSRVERRRVLRFTATDGVRLIGVVLGSGPRAVILAHQGGAAAPNLCSWVPYARSLAARGYRVLVFDHRGFGSSGRASRSTRQDRVDFDVLGAIRALRARGATSVVLGGASLGGAAVLSAAARALPAVNGVISFASPTTYVRIDALKAVRALRVPALFVAAEGDLPFPDEARALYDACASPDKRLAIFPGFAHGAPLLRNPDARATVDAFVESHSRS
jgi:dienelactone hydrolase